jgi:hypothetical protein
MFLPVKLADCEGANGDFQALSKLATLRLGSGIILGNRGSDSEVPIILWNEAASIPQRIGALHMKILLMACVATAALATAAIAADVKTSVQSSAASGAATNDTGTVGGVKPATAGAENVHSASPQVSGSMLSAWKTSADSYGYSGSANGCHFSGEGGPKGNHSNDNC